VFYDNFLSDSIDIAFYCWTPVSETWGYANVVVWYDAQHWFHPSPNRLKVIEHFVLTVAFYFFSVISVPTIREVISVKCLTGSSDIFNGDNPTTNFSVSFLKSFLKY